MGFGSTLKIKKNLSLFSRQAHIETGSAQNNQSATKPVKVCACCILIYNLPAQDVMRFSQQDCGSFIAGDVQFKRVKDFMSKHILSAKIILYRAFQNLTIIYKFVFIIQCA